MTSDDTPARISAPSSVVERLNQLAARAVDQADYEPILSQILLGLQAFGIHAIASDQDEGHGG